MFERFFPDVYMESTYAVPFEKLYEEGIRGVIFDIDSTARRAGGRACGRFVRAAERHRVFDLPYIQ